MMVFISISLANRKLTFTTHIFWARAVKLRWATSMSGGGEGGGGGGDVWMMQAQRNGRWGWQCWAVVDGVISASAVFQRLRLGQQIT